MGRNVRTAYEYGLMTGKSAGRFDPEGSLTAAEAIVEPLTGLSREAQLCAIAVALRVMTENHVAYSHQWTRVNVNGTYWICDAYGLYCGPELIPYQHPNIS